MHPNPHAGDDAEGALRADHQLAKVGSRGRLRCPAEVEHAGWRHGAQATDHVVEAAVAGGILARGPRRGESANGRELEALRKMPERVAALTEQALGLGARQPGAQISLA